jgi:hypothetical protein
LAGRCPSFALSLFSAPFITEAKAAKMIANDSNYTGQTKVTMKELRLAKRECSFSPAAGQKVSR